MNGRATSASAPKVVSSATNIRACISATGATSAAVSRSASTKRPSCVFGSARMRATGWRRSSGRCELADRLVERGAAGGDRVPELDQVALDRQPGRLVERAQHLVELDRLGLARGRAASSLPPGSPRSRSPWLISRYLSPSAERERTITVESSGSSRTSSSSLRSSRAEVDPSSCWTGTTSSTRPTRTPPIRTSLLGHERVRVRDLGRDPVGRNEREPGVRVVGEEHRDDHDQHGDRADHRRARGERSHRRAGLS